MVELSIAEHIYVFIVFALFLNFLNLIFKYWHSMTLQYIINMYGEQTIEPENCI